MKIVIKVIFAFVMCSYMAFGAEPILKVSALPSDSELEMYEESEGLFALKVLELYRACIILETQLSLMGIEAKSKVFQPTFEELEDMDFRIIRKYHRIAMTLEKEVLSAPETDRQLLLERINQLEKQLSDTVSDMIVMKGKITNDILNEMIARLIEQDQLYSDNLQLLRQQFFLNCRDYTTIFSIAGTGNVFVSNGGDHVTNDPGLGVKGSVNIQKLFGFWQGIDFWYEYLSPNFFTKYDIMGTNYTEKWGTNMHAVGLGSKLAVGKSDNLVHGLNMQLGYFWGKGEVVNRHTSNFSWDGYNINIEYFFGMPSCEFPFEIFVDFSIYHSFAKNLVFVTDIQGYDRLDLGKTHLGLSLGVRYNFWRSPF